MNRILTLAACNNKLTQTMHNYFNFTFLRRPCRYPTSFSSRAFPVHIQPLIQFPRQSFSLNFTLPFHTLRQLQQVVNTSDQSVQERRIPYKLHDHISHQKTEFILVFLAYEGCRSELRVCFQFLKGNNPMVATCLVASMTLSCSLICTCFLCSKGS